MGGDAFTPPTYTPEEGSSDGQDFVGPDFLGDDLKMKVEDAPFSTSLELQREHRRQKAFAEVSQTYEYLQLRGGSIEESRSKILSYVPGAWIENAGRVKTDEFSVPRTTTLILIGPKGSGKSSLINRISRVIEGDKFGPDRAQVSYDTQWTGNTSIGDGTCFLQEFMIPRGSTSFCIYDTRSLSEKTSENIDMIKRWMTKGVCPGELVTRKSDSSSFRRAKEHNCPRRNPQLLPGMVVNFVIFVVDAVAILKAMEAGGSKDTKYMDLIASTFSCPYLSFRDDKPVVVITHGDLLSMAERVRVRVHLGVLLNIPPATQIFDIPEKCDPATELTIFDMLRHSLEHADRNFPRKDSAFQKQLQGSSLGSFRFLLPVLVIFVISIFIRRHTLIRHQQMPEVRIDWNAIRHSWLGPEY